MIFFRNKKSLFILPITFLAIVPTISAACGTTNIKNSSEQKPSINTDNKENDSSNKTDDKADSSTLTPTPTPIPSPNDNGASTQPKPSNPTSPSESPKPDKNSSSENNAPAQPTQFSDLANVNQDIILSHIRWQKQQLNDIWGLSKQRPEGIVDLFKMPYELLSKYNIRVENNGTFIPSENKIIGIKIRFTNKEKTMFEVKTFSLQKPSTSAKPKQPLLKESFLTKKDLNSNILNLYPSLLAYMLLYNDNNAKYTSLENNHSNKNKTLINFEEITHSKNNLFNSNTPNLNVSLKNNFFDRKTEDVHKYDYKIDSVKYSDIQGTLGLSITIFNVDGNNSKEPSIQKEYFFTGFRKINFEKPTENVIGFNITQAKLKEIIDKQKNIKKLIFDTAEQKGIFYPAAVNLSELETRKLRSEIFKNLYLVINDNQNAYHLSYSDISPSSLQGLQQGFGIYPFYSRFHTPSITNAQSEDDFIKDIKIVISSDSSDKEVKVTFNVNLFVSEIQEWSDLQDNTGLNKKITLSIGSQFRLSQLTKDKAK